MLQITIPAAEIFDERTQTFDYAKEVTLQLEHSLVSIRKWESKWHKPYFSKKEKTYEETLDYIKHMTITQNVKDETYSRLSQENVNQIIQYIEDPMTATTFSEVQKTKGKGEQVTAELIYYWMIALQIPHEYQKWHINQLLTLVRVCDIKNSPPKNMSRREIMERNAALNAARRKRLNSKG